MDDLGGFLEEGLVGLQAGVLGRGFELGEGGDGVEGGYFWEGLAYH